ncbi:SRPBCC family protein [Streptomonospora algeriensis]|uniref:SRPBCC family protein n=1 Tax=Streptomonospora algeriensis TaxID=995084 RepID=A0ABW3BLL5_9ACTN
MASTPAPAPTGRLVDTAEGVGLELSRTLRAPVARVWATLTEPERTALWFGPWEGEGVPGGTVRVQLAFEEEQPWSDLRIDACRPPHRLAAAMPDEAGDWRMEALLRPAEGDATALRLVHHLVGTAGVEEIGPGWEYYLDMLGAAVAGTDRPAFGDYYPAQRTYFAELLRGR